MKTQREAELGIYPDPSLSTEEPPKIDGPASGIDPSEIEMRIDLNSTGSKQILGAEVYTLVSKYAEIHNINEEESS